MENFPFSFFLTLFLVYFFPYSCAPSSVSKLSCYYEIRLRSGSNARCRPLRVRGAGPAGGLGVWGETQFPRRPGPNTDPSVPETNLMVRNDGLVRVSALGTEGYSRPAPAGGGVGGHWVTRRGDGGGQSRLPGAPRLSGGGRLNR